MRNIITPAVLSTMIPQEFEDWRDGGEDLRRELTHAAMRDLTCPAGWDMNGEYRSEVGGVFFLCYPHAASLVAGGYHAYTQPGGSP